MTVNRLYHATVACAHPSMLSRARDALAVEVSRQVGTDLSPDDLGSTTTMERCADGCCMILTALGIAAADPDTPKAVL